MWVSAAVGAQASWQLTWKKWWRHRTYRIPSSDEPLILLAPASDNHLWVPSVVSMRPRRPKSPRNLTSLVNKTPTKTPKLIFFSTLKIEFEWLFNSKDLKRYGWCCSWPNESRAVGFHQKPLPTLIQTSDGNQIVQNGKIYAVFMKRWKCMRYHMIPVIDCFKSFTCTNKYVLWNCY